MKSAIFFLITLLPILFISCNPIKTEQNSINAIIGNTSFIKTFGYQPTKTTDESLIIKIHLKYVENLLRKKDSSHLNNVLKAKRNKILDLLHEYWNRGIFPRNYDHKGKRMPCFIDSDNNICAVGYLIERSAGREITEKINEKYKYSAIMEMNDPLVDDWIASSGLTKEECATIQPSYRYSASYLKIGASYRIPNKVFPSVEFCSETGAGLSSFKIQGKGVKLEYLNEKNFAISFKYFMNFSKSPRIYPIWSIAPVFFKYNLSYGINLKPEVSFAFLEFRNFFELIFCYGYDIPIVADSKYLISRHDLSLKLSIATNDLFSNKSPQNVKF